MKTIKIQLTAVFTLLIIITACNKEETPQETPNKAPTCEITAPNNEQEFTQDESITISVNAEDNDGSITEVRFSIDGVRKGSANSFPYNYNWNTAGENTGNYTLKATSFDNDGSNSSDEINVKLISGSSGEAPVANFSATPTSGTAPLNVIFTDQSENNPISWQWNFGDGNASTQQNPSHTYNSDGYFNVSLTVTNDDGSDTETKTNYIYAGSGGATGTFTDPRDGQTYATIEIGSQIWFAENINYEMGDSWWYDNSSANGDVYGRLYTWDAALNACPNGWYLPNDEEWKTMEMYLGMSQSEADNTSYRGTDEGEKMKTISGWNDNGNGTNSSGFNAFPGGFRSNFGSFSRLGSYGLWWSSTEYSGSRAWFRDMYYNSDQVHRDGSYKTYGFSVRCLKD